ncbi:vWA domain-containing protein [Parachryseolinea silvisoli]|uniref:vWA domain-containing protein n=1 Tax=Parachryseolinea silvisoli TaxID=2873601 RepID=UPI0022659384|nr:VWA domain-containing protein [Parachryseolinea silvisoli]MCD9017801.1 VWA domain-containing protein [Parachryseolinea silvisoli]
MLWYRDFGITEIVFITLFVVLYALYVVRTVRIARRMNSPFSIIFAKLFVRTLYFALFIIVILGPSFGGSKKEVKSVGKDIMICVDLSKSMDAFDIAPTRLEKVKFEMKKVVEAFSSDRIGVIIFSSEAFMQCPLTYDQNALNLFIETMSSTLVPASGTDFGPPLRLALKKLEEETDGPTTQSKSKVIILISDGEDFGEDSREVASEIESKDIKLFTLGVGTEAGGNIYAGRSLKTDRQGNTVTTRLNSSALRGLADKTDGQYFEINAARNDVSRLINTIGNIEGELRDARFVDVTANKYFYFLVAAVVLLILDVLINVPALKL